MEANWRHKVSEEMAWVSQVYGLQEDAPGLSLFFGKAGSMTTRGWGLSCMRKIHCLGGGLAT